MNICPKCNSIYAKTALLACDPNGERIKTCKDCGCKYTNNWVYSEKMVIPRNEFKNRF